MSKIETQDCPSAITKLPSDWVGVSETTFYALLNIEKFFSPISIGDLSLDVVYAQPRI